MKILHMSDLHIGLRLYGRDLWEDQAHIFRQIAAIAKEQAPDAVVIAGDVYDKGIPSAEAVRLFDSFMNALTEAVPEAEIMVISGNHDSPQRLNLFRSLLQRRRIHMIGLPPQAEGEYIEKVTLHDAFGPVHFYLLPFVKPSMVRRIVGTDGQGNNLSYDAAVRALIARENIDPQERSCLVSHQFYLPAGADPDAVERTDSEIRTVGNIDEVRADVLDVFDYAALGHIHKAMKVGREGCRYAGTPLACSVSEAGQTKGVILAELGEKGKLETSFIPLTPLRQVRVLKGTLAEVLSEACEDYVSIMLTGEEDAGPDLADRLRHAFPYLLEVRRESRQLQGREDFLYAAEMPDPYDLCLDFLKDAGEAEKKIMQDVLNDVLEGEGRP